VPDAVREVVRRQRETGLDIVGDGEFSKPGFSTYILDRYAGFGGQRGPLVSKEFTDFPGAFERRGAPSGAPPPRMQNCEAPITLRDRDAVHRDIANLRAALGDLAPDSAFLTAPSPGQIAFNFPNRYYPSHAAYLAAAGDALRYEYQAILDAGLNLQIDSPDLAMAGHLHVEGSDFPDFREHLGVAIEALNAALAGLSMERVRLHVCWGNYPGPHNRDVELRSIVHEILRAAPRYLYLEAANPRHAHEWEVWQDVGGLPDDKALIVGVVDVLGNHLEHPRLVAQRIVQFANVVGRERVIAATDCGFSTFAGMVNCDPDVAWAKLGVLVEGAAEASRVLFGRI
jgi:5-methyltetrahydropteroyltriglutamate--homocysteine methyltransferase